MSPEASKEYERIVLAAQAVFIHAEKDATQKFDLALKEAWVTFRAAEAQAKALAQTSTN